MDRKTAGFVYSRNDKKLYAVDQNESVIGERYWNDKLHQNFRPGAPVVILEELEAEEKSGGC